jgi:hypothetical protein
MYRMAILINTVMKYLVFVVQREYLRYLNRQEEKGWSSMSEEENIVAQNDQAARELDGNKRLDFKFKY